MFEITQEEAREDYQKFKTHIRSDLMIDQDEWENLLESEWQTIFREMDWLPEQDLSCPHCSNGCMRCLDLTYKMFM